MRNKLWRGIHKGKMNPDPWVTIALEEYKTLRDEIQGALRNQYLILGLGLATIGVTAGLGFDWLSKTGGWVIFALVIPSFTVATYFIYAIEFARMIRAGCYLEAREWLFRRKFGKDVLGWEIWETGSNCRCAQPQRLPFYLAIPAVFFGATLVSNILAILAGVSQEPPLPYWMIVSISILSLGVSTLLIIYASNRLLGLRESYEKSFPEEWRNPAESEARDKGDESKV